jgi:hypothetical protein
MDSYLRQHPEIFIPDGKDIHFFGSDLLRHKYGYGLDEYLHLFEAAEEGQLIGESSAFYLYSRVAAAEIREFSSHAKILIMLRDPVEVIRSLHAQMYFTGIEEIADLEAALGAEAEREGGGDAARGEGAEGSLDPRLYTRVARFSEQVERYFEAFGRESVKVTLYDDLEADTEGTYREVLRFLGVDPRFSPSFDVVNAAKRPRSMMLRTIASDPPHFLRSLARKLMPPRTRHKIVEGLMSINVKRAANAPMDPALRQRLRSQFAPEVDRLSGLLGRDLTGWNRP